MKIVISLRHFNVFIYMRKNTLKKYGIKEVTKRMKKEKIIYMFPFYFFILSPMNLYSIKEKEIGHPKLMVKSILKYKR